MGSVDTNDWCISFQCFYQIKFEINDIKQLSNIFEEDSLNWSLIPGRSLRLSDSQKNVPGIKSMISVDNDIKYTILVSLFDYMYMPI